MISSEMILSLLPVYNGKVEIIADDQSVYDIIQGVKDIHKRYADQYDIIAPYFIQRTPEQTCRYIFNFLRRSSFYYIETDEKQTLRSPSAILATGKIQGLDCKNYALFIGGVLDAINRTGIQEIPYAYRFATDMILDPTPCHVFIVAWPGSNDEVWIDPIPPVNYFNEHLLYYYHIDKKYKSMSLSSISGRKIGDYGDTLTQAANGNYVSAAISLVSNIVGSGGPNPNDWKGWHSDGSDARHWILNDGDSVPNEAVNVLKYIQAHGMATLLSGDAANRAVTVSEIANKLSRGGFGAQAAQFLQTNMGSGGSTSHTIDPVTGLPQPNYSNKSNNNLILFGVIGAGALYFITKKKRVSGVSTPMVLVGAGIAAYFFLHHKQAPTVTEQIIKQYGLADNENVHHWLDDASGVIRQQMLDGTYTGNLPG